MTDPILRDCINESYKEHIILQIQFTKQHAILMCSQCAKILHPFLLNFNKTNLS